MSSTKTVENEFTPGPYVARFSRTYSGGQYDIVADNGRINIAETISGPHEANARLLAASPDLLRELQNMVALWEICGDLSDADETTDFIVNHYDEVDTAIEAIRNALGQNDGS